MDISSKFGGITTGKALDFTGKTVVIPMFSRYVKKVQFAILFYSTLFYASVLSVNTPYCPINDG